MERKGTPSLPFSAGGGSMADPIRTSDSSREIARESRAEVSGEPEITRVKDKGEKAGKK